MDRFQLTNDLLTGIDDIDAQHRMLFELANQVVDPTTERGADAAFFASLSFLADYVQYHFAAEELAMQQTAFPERERHVRAHDEFRQYIGEFVEASLETPSITEIRVRLTDAIVGWLTDHIRLADKALALYLRLHAGEGMATLPNLESLTKSGFIETRIDLSQLEAAIGLGRKR